MHAPVCTMGPSFPSTNPAETPSIEPNICKEVKEHFQNKLIPLTSKLSSSCVIL
jgi:hypothetical protein